jgi:hypothetical protein
MGREKCGKCPAARQPELALAMASLRPFLPCGC